MGYWKVVVPTITNNYVLNPSAETTGNYTARGAATVTRAYSYETTNPYSTSGLYGYKIVTAGAGTGINLTMATHTVGSDTIFSCHLYSPTVGHPPPLRWTVNAGASWNTLTDYAMQLTSLWYWYQMHETGGAVGGSTTLSIEQNAAGVNTFYLDCLMVAKEYAADPTILLTYVDGDQPGCVWAGLPHGSRSQRMNVVRSGGALFDFQDDLNFQIGSMIGTGAASHAISAESMALLPGAQIAGEKLERRSFALGGVITGTSQSNFHANKEDLLLALSGQVVPESSGHKQPVQIWYTGALPVKYVDATYEGGLEGNFNARTDPCYWEQNVAIQMMAVNPLWKNVVERSILLDEMDAAASYCLAVRRNIPNLASTSYSQWGNLDLSAITAGAGGGTVIYAAVWGPDGCLYIGGDFINLNGDANMDYIARYNINAAIPGWERVGTTVMNERVFALCFGPDGYLYAGGMFTNAGGDAAADYIAKVDPNAAVPAWANVGGGPTGGATVTSVNALCFDRVGNLIIGGNFTNWSGDADMDHAVYFDGTSYQQFSPDELNGAVYAVAASPDGWIYFGGAFTSADDTLNYIARIKIGMADYAALDAGGAGFDDAGTPTGYVYAIEVDSTGRRVWIGGDFTTTEGGVTVNYICLWNGTQFEALGSGVTDIVRAIKLGPDDALWVGGDFTTITGVGACSAVAKWVSQSWAPIDVQFSAVPDIQCIALGNAVPPTVRNYNVALGTDATATMYYSDPTTVDHDGTWMSYPKVIFRRTGDVAGRLGNVRIGPTGAELYLNYTVQLGEDLTIDTDPQTKTVISEFYGQRSDALLPPSDFGTFSLLPEWQDMDTRVYWFAETTGDTDLACWLLWRDTFESQD